MTYTVIEINHATHDDIYICCKDCGNISTMSDMIDNEKKLVTDYMCEANAKEFHKIICALEILAYEARKSYDKWKTSGFSKAADEA